MDILLPQNNLYDHNVPIMVNVLEGFSVINGKDAEETLPCPHILVSHCTIFLLTCSIQNVQEAGLPIDNHLFSIRVLQENRWDLWWIYKNCTCIEQKASKLFKNQYSLQSPCQGQNVLLHQIQQPSRNNESLSLGLFGIHVQEADYGGASTSQASHLLSWWALKYFPPALLESPFITVAPSDGPRRYGISAHLVFFCVWAVANWSPFLIWVLLRLNWQKQKVSRCVLLLLILSLLSPLSVYQLWVISGEDTWRLCHH